MERPSSHPVRRRLRLEYRGAVQGVGFRPHVYRLARALELAGWVGNDTGGVVLEVEGPEDRLRRFALELLETPPPAARIQGVEEAWLDPVGHDGFAIRTSDAHGVPRAVVLPDLALCPACREDVLEPGGRRFGYPFTNCTDCGPRFSIVRGLPYDRPNTTMAGFALCPECAREYGDPEDRRFHAQPNACARCGPGLMWWDRRGPVLGVAGDQDALRVAVRALRSGEIVAVKGLGGFHLLVDAGNEAAVARLRRRKGREAKPLAVMAPDLESARELAEVSEAAGALLESAAAPIVLLPRREDAPLAPSVAPGNPRVGVMLPYTPLHLLLLRAFGGPVVATSGNRSEEPICIDEGEAVQRLGGIADGFLVHDRPIQRHVDDSVATVDECGFRILRRARGYAPFPLVVPGEIPPLLAVGGHLKNTVAVARGDQVWISQHIGDLETEEAQAAFRRTVDDFLRLYRVEPQAVVHDLHPDYASTRWVRDEADPALPRIGVQHHHAHLASVLAEAGTDPEHRALGIVWDGVGYGTDGTVWGGEFLVGGLREVRRAGFLRPFQLPGGEAAVREPRRSALGLLLASGVLGAAGTDGVVNAFTPGELRVLEQATAREVNAPVATSAGRLFDALASLLGLCHQARFEGEGAMALEFAADPREAGAYLLSVETDEEGGRVVDWEPLVQAVLTAIRRGVPVPVVAARIHNGLAEAMARMAALCQLETVALSGGCFQNHLLLREARRRLEHQGHQVLTNRQVPPGDGGISLGQVAVAAARLAAGPALVPGRAAAHPPSRTSLHGDAPPSLHGV